MGRASCTNATGTMIRRRAGSRRRTLLDSQAVSMHTASPLAIQLTIQIRSDFALTTCSRALVTQSSVRGSKLHLSQRARTLALPSAVEPASLLARELL